MNIGGFSTTRHHGTEDCRYLPNDINGLRVAGDLHQLRVVITCRI